MIIPKIDAVIFDFDGTLCDSLQVKEEAFGELYREYGKKISHKVMAFHRENLGVPRERKFVHFQKNIVKGDYSENQISKLSLLFSNIVKEKVISAPLLVGAKEFLEDNYKHLDIFLSSATPEEELIEIVTKKELINFFKLIFGSPKTKISHINQILSMGYGKDNVVYVGDAEQDMIAASQTDISFIGIDKNNFPSNTQTIENLSKLTSALQSLKRVP